MRWKGEPTRLRPEDYDLAREAFLELAVGTPGVLGVWETGSVSAPGISDMDLLVITEDNARVSWHEMRGKLRPEMLRPLLHSPFAVPKSLFPFLAYITDVRGLRRLQGPEMEIRRPSCPEIIDLLVVARFTAKRLMSLKKTMFTGTGRIRTLLCQLHATRHNFALWNAEIPGFVKRVQALRQGWFDAGPEKYSTLEQCVKEAFEACAGLLGKPPGGLIPEKGFYFFVAENWVFYGGRGQREKKGALSWLPKVSRLGEVAYYSTRFELGVARGLPGLLSGALPPLVGQEDWETHHRILREYKRAMDNLPGFAGPGPRFGLEGWRRWVP